jgi:hypothetical protein
VKGPAAEDTLADPAHERPPRTLLGFAELVLVPRMLGGMERACGRNREVLEGLEDGRRGPRLPTLAAP